MGLWVGRQLRRPPLKHTPKPLHLQELAAVIAGGPGSAEGVMCLQTVFGLLDTLQRWVEDARVSRARGDPAGGGQAGTDGERWAALARVLEAVPLDALAQASLMVFSKKRGKEGWRGVGWGPGLRGRER